jgi:hypothetical protein
MAARKTATKPRRRKVPAVDLITLWTARAVVHTDTLRWFLHGDPEDRSPLEAIGLGGLATQLLGPLHVHARVQKAQPAPSTLDRWLVRIDHMVDHVVDHLLEHAHPAGTRHALARPQDDRAVNDDVRAAAHAHAHARAERHHHDPNHADVFAVAEPERDDGPGTSGWAWQVVAPGSASGALPERTDAGRWPSAPADALDSRPPERLERPPRA